MGTVFKTLYPKVAEIEIENGRKKDTFPVIRYNLPEPITFIPVPVDTVGRIYEDFSRLLFLHTHREDSALSNEIPEESEQFRFLRAA